ncbi:MAG: hypothetical protein AAF573_19430 [Bacteroidota bacterium]
MNFRNTNLSFGQSVGLHFLLASLLYCILYALGEIKVLPNTETLISWDAVNYYTIQHRGYVDYQAPTSNIPFFPFVGLIWRWLHLSVYGATVLNIVFFLLGFFLLHRHFHFSTQNILLYVSVPSIFFLCVPYAEALFFLSSVLAILGLEKKNYWLMSLGFILAAMTRPSAMFFLPAIFFVELVSLSELNWANLKNAMVRIFLMTSMVVTGLMIVFWIQYEATGEWFAFFKQRDKNSFRIPQFPLTTWRGAKLLWLDGLAYAVALSSFFLGVKIFCTQFFLKNRSQEKTPKAVLFSLAFLAMTMIHILFFNDKSDSTNPTSLFGLNRFVFATPFFVVVFNYFLDRLNFQHNRAKYSLFLFLILFLWMVGIFHFSNYPDHLRPLVYFLFIVSFLLLKDKFKRYWILVYVVHISTQVLLFDKFLRGIWVG